MCYYIVGFIIIFSTSVLSSLDLKYLGCYNDSGDRALEHSESIHQVTIEKCIARCQEGEYTYAGLQFSRECFCGNSYDKHGEANSPDECDMTCSGNRNQKCGAGHKNSVYTTCQQVKGDPREPVQEMNTAPGNYLNIFSHLEFHDSGHVTEIEYFAVKAGHAYVSFWVNMYPNWEMVGKILVTSNHTGRQVHKVNPEQSVYVTSGNVVGIHYPQGEAKGIIYYEIQERGRTQGLNTNNLGYTYNANKQDSGWAAGRTFEITKTWHITAALHIVLHCFSPECDDGYYGYNCVNQCFCKNLYCDKLNGRCPSGGCQAGYHGESCNEECTPGRYGENCQHICSQNCKYPPCVSHSTDGHCPNDSCNSGYKGVGCRTECTPGRYGENCQHICSQNCKYPPCVSQSTDGHCPSDSCNVGYKGVGCRTACDDGEYGENCMQKCSDHCKYPPCVANSTNGRCPQLKCKVGFNGDNCSTECDNGTFGENCDGECFCKEETCNKLTGFCNVEGCSVGYSGSTCSAACSPGTYGLNCSRICPQCLAPQDCDHITGHCTKCPPERKGRTCDTKLYGQGEEIQITNMVTVAVCVTLVVIILILTVAAYFFIKISRNRNTRQTTEQQNNESYVNQEMRIENPPYEDITQEGIYENDNGKLDDENPYEKSGYVEIQLPTYEPLAQ